MSGYSRSASQFKPQSCYLNILIILNVKNMAIKSVWIEEDCIACGTCEGICPEVFQVTDRSRVNEGVNFNDYEEGIKEAAESCPVSVIKYD